MKKREGYAHLLAEIDLLKAWIRDLGEQSDTCTYPVLKEICKGCRCKRKPKPGPEVAA